MGKVLNIFLISVISCVVFFVVRHIFQAYGVFEGEQLPLNLTTVIFDFDGTLADSMDTYLELANKIAEESGFKGFHNREELRRLGMIKALRSSGMGYLQFPRFALKFKSDIIENKDKIELFDGAKEAIIELSKEFQLAIITSNEIEIVDHVLRKNGVREYFEFVHSTGFASFQRLIFGKSGVILDSLRSINTKTNEAIYVGDEVRDITSCKKTRLKIIAITHGYNSKEYLLENNPDYTADSIEEMVNIIRRLKRKNIEEEEL